VIRAAAVRTLEIVLVGFGVSVLTFLMIGLVPGDAAHSCSAPPTASLGRMLAESRNFLTFSPWPAVFSGIAILLAALGFNLLGDGLQDALDPRMRSRT